MYEWIDPWEEISRLRRRAEHAYIDGQAHVVRELSEERVAQDFHRALEERTDQIAEVFAFERIRPHMLQHLEEFQQYRRLRRQQLEVFRAVAQPVINYVVAEGRPQVAVMQAPTSDELLAVFKWTVQRPFEYHVALSLPFLQRWEDDGL